jgi:hypothetical protein
MAQFHKESADSQVKESLERYVGSEGKIEYTLKCSL